MKFMSALFRHANLTIISPVGAISSPHHILLLLFIDINFGKILNVQNTIYLPNKLPWEQV